jgi:hypothetical protein
LLGLERDTDGRPFAHVGTENENGPAYAGMAFMTFSESVARELAAKARSSCAVAGLHRPEATWLRPELRVRVRHLRNAKDCATRASDRPAGMTLSKQPVVSFPSKRLWNGQRFDCKFQTLSN